MKKLLAIILSITMLFSMTAVAFADGVNGPMQKAKIKVATSADFPPFEYYESEELKGFDVDLMNYIGERTGFDIEFVNMSFDKLIPAVVNGEVNCAISAISVTDERKKVIDFSEIYLDTYEQIDETSSQITNYAIVFHGDSSEKEKLIEASGDTTKVLIYTLVNNAIKELKNDATIEKLMEKYNISKADYAQGSGCPAGSITIVDDEKTIPGNIIKNDTTSAITVPVPSDWAKDNVDIADAVGITDKTQPYYYHNNITREEFCELIYNLIVIINPGFESFVSDSFTDTKNEKILRLSSIGIINGKTATEFAPDDYLTREEAATIINRMVEKGYVKLNTGTTAQWVAFNDEKEISEWALFSIQNIYKMGIMNGIGNNKFAPGDNYTIEQAIVTLARIYERAAIDDSSIGIIGGADGPTAIIVGSDTTIIEKDEYKALYDKAKSTTVSIPEFYKKEAIKLISVAGKLASNRDFISLYTSNDEITEKILSIGSTDFEKPTDIFMLTADRDKIISNIGALAGEDADSIDFEKLEKINKKYTFSTLASLINSSYGAENLAALTILTNSRGYIMPKDFKDDFALFVQYEGEYSAIVSFSEYGDKVISANMSFVRNGDKDNLFRRLHEISSAVGEDSVTIAKVK